MTDPVRIMRIRHHDSTWIGRQWRSMDPHAAPTLFWTLIPAADEPVKARQEAFL